MFSEFTSDNKGGLMTGRPASSLIAPQTISIAIANSLRERILRGDFKEGQPLLQDALAAEFGVSRIPLREAMRQLETEGLITSIPHRGCMVTVLSLEEVVELSEIRALLECDVLAYAVPNMTEDHFDRAQKVLDICADLLAQGADEFDCGALNWEFHSILYEASNRKRSLMLILNLHNSPDQLARMKVAAALGLENIHRKHCEILEFCRQGNVEKAVESLRENILEACEALKKHMAGEQPDNTL